MKDGAVGGEPYSPFSKAGKKKSKSKFAGRIKGTSKAQEKQKGESHKPGLFNAAQYKEDTTNLTLSVKLPGTSGTSRARLEGSHKPGHLFRNH